MKVFEIINPGDSTRYFPIYDFFQWRVSQSHPSKKGTVKDLPHNNYGILVSSEENIEWVKSQSLTPNYLYLPGDVCRQSDILAKASESGFDLIIEKAPFLPPADIEKILSKIKHKRVILISCGESFGYGNHVFDPRSFFFFKESGCSYGINMNELLHTFSDYDYTPYWIKEYVRFIPFLLQSLKAVDGQVVVLDQRHVSWSDHHKSQLEAYLGGEYVS